MFVGTFAGVDGAFWAGVVSTIIRGVLSAGMVAVASAALRSLSGIRQVRLV